ncbi:TetR family transcriptional regulator [Desulfatibacillum aliphaticivorans]|uniref:TetR family transcriptional regulator n=1 Tax=Desulfatibacillum aliphaticivorans TaxID=218208 RepID=UPI0003FF2D4D|nr:TetR family transcriptional regulator [Desulfatibacillum aliphaticivorans]
MKNRILDHALELLGQKGFDGLTMRGVARSMGVSSGTLYVYYENKDELYLAVLTKGFERLHEKCRTALEGVAAPMDRLKALAAAYLDFGLEDSHFYNLMFTWHVPKFQDYFGTPMEAAASHELAVSQEFYNFALQPIREIGKHLKGRKESDPCQKTGVFYGDAKMEAEALVKGYESRFAGGAVIVRPSNVIGPGSVWVAQVGAIIQGGGFAKLVWQAAKRMPITTRQAH